MNRTSIEWTDLTWNPIRARRKDGKAATKTRDHGTFCTKISPGCANCYASVINKRFGTGLEFSWPYLDQHEFFIDQDELVAPIRRKKPAKIFVGDMFDLFHERIPGELIEEVFLQIVHARQHTFQILTKRALRMKQWVSMYMYRPHSHICFGVSVESQKYADERTPLLLQTPAAVRFLSVEPMLEAIDLQTNRHYLRGIQDTFRAVRGLTLHAHYSRMQREQRTMSEFPQFFGHDRPTNRVEYDEWRRLQRLQLADADELFHEFMQQYVWFAIEVCQGNREEAAMALGIGRTKLYKILREARSDADQMG